MEQYEVHTHSNAINFWTVCKFIVSIQSLLCESNSCTNQSRVCLVVRVWCELLVNMIHGRDHSSKVWCWTREVQSRVLENLEHVVSTFWSLSHSDKYTPSIHPTTVWLFPTHSQLTHTFADPDCDIVSHCQQLSYAQVHNPACQRWNSTELPCHVASVSQACANLEESDAMRGVQ